MACQNIERIYNEIAEKKYPEIVAGRKRAEMRADKAEEKANKAEEKANKAEEKANKVEEENTELKNKVNRTVKKLLQAGKSVDYVSELMGMNEKEVLASMEA